MKGRSHVLATIGLIAVLTACGDAKDANDRNFSKALDRYLETQSQCIRLPIEALPGSIETESNGLRMGGATSIERLDALAEAGALTATDALESRKQLFGGEREVAVRRYDLSAGTEQATSDKAGTSRPQLCYGQPALGKIVRFTDPSDMMGMKISQVVYTTQLTAVPAWAKQEGVQRVWPEIAEAQDEDKHHNDVLILTNEGWIHEKMMDQ